MKGQFVLVSGSAAPSCSSLQLAIATRFVQFFVPEVLKAGGSLVVLTGDENRTKDANGNPHIFDWTILRAIEEYLGVTTQSPRVYAQVVMADDAWQSRMDDGNRRTFGNLQQHGVLAIARIRREEFTGGKYRRVECELADAMIALGGGRGTYSVGREMIELGKPVLPFDLEIGAFSKDGDGALLLHRELQTEPDRFFPITHRDIVNQIEALSLQRGSHDPAGVAQRAVEILSRELDRAATGKRLRIKRLVSYVERPIRKILNEMLKQMFGGG